MEKLCALVGYISRELQAETGIFPPFGRRSVLQLKTRWLVASKKGSVRRAWSHSMVLEIDEATLLERVDDILCGLLSALWRLC